MFGCAAAGAATLVVYYLCVFGCCYYWCVLIANVCVRALEYNCYYCWRIMTVFCVMSKTSPFGFVCVCRQCRQTKAADYVYVRVLLSLPVTAILNAKHRVWANCSVRYGCFRITSSVT